MNDLLITATAYILFSMNTPERQGWSVNGQNRQLDSRSVGTPSRRASLLKRSNSRESLLSVSESRNAEEFRVCEYCEKLLQRRDAAIELQTSKPIVTQFYDKLKVQMVEGEELRHVLLILKVFTLKLFL